MICGVAEPEIGADGRPAEDLAPTPSPAAVGHLPAPEPVFLGLEPDPVFGLLHAPRAGMPPAAGVLLCSPWGWEDVASHRTRRAWAQHLAGAGHPTLRFDLPACGDSGGSPRDPGRVEAWSTAIASAADWLRDGTGCARVTVIGLGLGGLMARRALAEGARIDDLVLWAAPKDGSAFVRRQRASARLQQARHPLASSLPDGWLEAEGFVLSADTVAALEALRIEPPATGGLRRALLLARDGSAADERLREALQEAGVDVSTGPGNGWHAMVADPEDSPSPREVIDLVDDWLARSPAPADERAQTERAPLGRKLVLDIDGVAVRESPLVFDLSFGRPFGLLCEPANGQRGDVAVVFLNAGLVRRSGPNRMWTEGARRWAARGMPALRIDLEGIGDADGDSARYADDDEFFAPKLVDQVGEVLDELCSRGVARHFVLVGLCSSGYWAFRIALGDRRVRAALVVNPFGLVWDPELLVRHESQKLHRLREREWWGRIARGKLKLASVRTVSRALLLGAVATVRRVRASAATRHAAAKPALERELDRLDGGATRVVMAFTTGESVRDELERDGVLARLHRWPGVTVEDLPGRDHTLRSVTAQRAFHELLDRELWREHDKAGRRPASGVLGESVVQRSA